MADSTKEGHDEACVLQCLIKKPVFLRVGSPTVEFKSGCSVVDVIFYDNEPVEIGTISFTNNYTASLSIKFRTPDNDWIVCVKDYKLMPSAHFEEGSQKRVSINSDQMVHPIKNAVLLRIILRQPSPHWINFSIEQLQFFPPTKISSSLSDVLLSNAADDDVDDDDESNHASKDHTRVVEVANKLQRMWAMTEQITNDQLEEPTHFDIDGCYDLNLLSYT